MPRCAALGLLLFCVAAAWGQGTTNPPVAHALGLDDLSKIRHVGNPTLSPAGDAVAFTVSSVDTAHDRTTTSLWVMPLPAGDSSAVQLVADGIHAPQWNPDGRSVSYLAAGSGKAGGTQVWQVSRSGGTPQQVTSISGDLLAFRWSPDGERLLLNLRDGEPAATPTPAPVVITRYQFKDDRDGYLTTQHNHLYLYTLATHSLERLLCEPDEAEESDGAWSPDGRQIAFLSQRAQPRPDHTEDTDLFLTAAQPGSTPRRLTHDNRVLVGPLTWSAAGERIAYRQAREPGYSSYTELEPAVISTSGGTPQVFGHALDRPFGDVFFSADGRALLSSVVDDRDVYPVHVPLDGGAPSRLLAGDGTTDELLTSHGHTVLLWSGDTSFPELYVLEAGGTLRRLTRVNDALLQTLQLQPARDLEARTADGTSVHGLLTLPVGYQPGTRVPLLLEIHGGPVEQDSHGFALTRQVFTAHGYAVLNVNYRGSNGRGFAYSRAIERDWGDKEVTDLLAMVDAAVRTGSIDPDRLAVEGWSYGGILTDDLIAHTDRFRAASSGAGRGNLLGAYGVSEYVLQYDNELGPPWKDPELYLQQSYPFIHANRIHTPTLFMSGDRDFNVPLAGSEQMYQALRSAGTPTELVIYPGQHHIFTRPSFIRDRYERWFRWYDGYLGRSSSPATPPQPQPPCPPAAGRYSTP